MLGFVALVLWRSHRVTHRENHCAQQSATSSSRKHSHRLDTLAWFVSRLFARHHCLARKAARTTVAATNKTFPRVFIIIAINRRTTCHTLLAKQLATVAAKKSALECQRPRAWYEKSLSLWLNCRV